MKVNSSHISFGAIKGMITLHNGVMKFPDKDKVMVVPFMLPDKCSISLKSSQDGHIVFSHMPYNKFDSIHINNIDNGSFLELNNDVEVNIDKLGNMGMVIVNNTAKANIEEMDGGIIELYNHSKTNLNKALKSNLRIFDRAQLKVDSIVDSTLFMQGDCPKVIAKDISNSKVIENTGGMLFVDTLKNTNALLEGLSRIQAKAISGGNTFLEGQSSLIVDRLAGFLHQVDRTLTRIYDLVLDGVLSLNGDSQSYVHDTKPGSKILGNDQSWSSISNVKGIAQFDDKATTSVGTIEPGAIVSMYSQSKSSIDFLKPGGTIQKDLTAQVNVRKNERISL